MNIHVYIHIFFYCKHGLMYLNIKNLPKYNYLNINFEKCFFITFKKGNTSAIYIYKYIKNK